ncbi:MAG: AI-2E family transporter [Thermoleophilia bacterium]
MKEKILVPRYVQQIVLPLALVFSFWFINIVRTNVILFALAFVLAFVLDQPVSLMQKKIHVPRLVAVLIVWLLIFSIFGALLAFLVPNIISELNGLIDSLPEYASKIEKISSDVQRWFGELDLPYKPDITPQDVAGKLQTAATDIAQKGLSLAEAIFNIGLNIFLIFIISMYMLIDAERLRKTARKSVPEQFRDDAVRLFRKMQKALGSYLRGQLLVSTVMGILGGLIAWYGGSGTYVFIIAVWVALTEVVPLIGPFLGAAPAVVLAWFTVNPNRALIVAILFLAVQQLEGHILVPRIMGRSVGVHPLWVMFAVLSGATIAGILGGLIAVPLVAIIKVLVDFYREELVLEKWQRPLLEKTPLKEEAPSGPAA